MIFSFEIVLLAGPGWSPDEEPGKVERRMQQGRDQGLEPLAPVSGPWFNLAHPTGRIEDAPIFKITAAIADAVTEAEVYEALVDHVAEAAGASSAALWLVDRDGQAATLVRSRGYAPEAVNAMQVLEVGGSVSLPVVDCIRTGAPLWIPSQGEVYDRYPHVRPLTTPGRSYRVSCLPLVARARVLGSLCLTIEEAGEATEEERSSCYSSPGTLHKGSSGYASTRQRNRAALMLTRPLIDRES